MSIEEQSEADARSRLEQMLINTLVPLTTGQRNLLLEARSLTLLMGKLE